MARPCPLFVSLVEEGLLDHPLTHLACAEYLAPLREAAVDTLILGCTHYPLLKPAVARYMGADVALVDSAETLAAAAEECLRGHGLLRAGDDGGKLSFYLSDLPWTFREEGARYLGREIEPVETVNLDDLERDGLLAPCLEGRRR